ncbi:MAG: hypothetical protein HYZ44_17435 [Bacteroidetes bacterium]|nr:hypothetical protein [Bacteroidota bacterium]
MKQLHYLMVIALAILPACQRPTQQNSNAKKASEAPALVTEKKDSTRIAPQLKDFVRKKYDIINRCSFNHLNIKKYHHFIPFTMDRIPYLEAEIVKDEVDEFVSRSTSKYDNVFLRHWKFRSEVSAQEIHRLLTKDPTNSDDYYVKEPHVIYINGTDLYIYYVRAEYSRPRIVEIKQILEDSVGIKGSYDR